MIDLEFEEAIKECAKYKKNLLLGNGFSRAYNDTAFNYKHLLEASKLPQKLKYLFEIFKTEDYERVINNLETLEQIFNNKENIVKELRPIEELIKRDLVRTITNKHPTSQYEIEPERKAATLSFLSKFENIFTVNYDLLLYWLIIFNIKDCDKFWGDMNDGFSENSLKDCIWQTDRLMVIPNVFYLHGGLHLFNDERDTYKIKYDNENGVSLLKQIKAYIKHNISPLVITEGNSIDKKSWIEQNNYLQYCYNKLSEIEGCLFIHGHSLDETDQHIFDAINKNFKIKKIYISVHKDFENLDDKKELAKKRFCYKSHILHYYDAESTNIWKLNNENS